MARRAISERKSERTRYIVQLIVGVAFVAVPLFPLFREAGLFVGKEALVRIGFVVIGLGIAAGALKVLLGRQTTISEDGPLTITTGSVRTSMPTAPPPIKELIIERREFDRTLDATPPWWLVPVCLVFAVGAAIVFGDRWGGVPVPIALLGVGILPALAYYGTCLTLSRPTVRANASEINLGGDLDLTWKLDHGWLRASRLQVYLEAREWAQGDCGEVTVRSSRTLQRIDMVDSQDRNTIASGHSHLRVPDDAMHTFESPNHGVTWSLGVRVGHALLPGYKLEKSITVCPSPLPSENRSGNPRQETEPFLPGDMLEGSARWELKRAVEAIEIRLVWHIANDSSNPASIVSRTRVDAPTLNGSFPYCFRIPDGPYSFYGEHFKVAWAIETVSSDGVQLDCIEFDVAPRGAWPPSHVR